MTFGVYLAAAMLLAGAGIAKAARPGDTSRALGASLRWWPHRAGPALVRLAAIGEAALGAAALVWPGRAVAGAVAFSYAAFVAFLLVARARGGPLATCGCFGQPDTPPTLTHVAVDAGAALAAAGVAAGGPGPYRWPLVAAAVVAAWLAYLVLVPLTRVRAA